MTIELFNDPDQLTTHRVITLQSGLKLFAWAATLLAALSIANLPGEWGHSVCGAWGCGPPTQALVSCHLAWFVVLTPLAVMASRWSHKTTESSQLLGKLFCLTGAFLLIAVVIYQAAAWWPAASEWQRTFFWQRCGFVIVTSVDIPMLQLLTVGIVMSRRGRRSVFPPEESAFSPEVGEVRL